MTVPWEDAQGGLRKVLGHTDPSEVADDLWTGFRKCELGFDVGANCGQSISPMLAICQHVKSFEPHVLSYGIMRDKWAAWRNVEPLNLAVSDVDGFLELAQLDGRPRDTGQLVTVGLSGMEWDPGDWSGVERVQVSAMTIDSLTAELGTPGFVKVDTEGHELHVLRGAMTVLPDAQWLIEFHSPENHGECVRLLEEAGLTVVTVRHPHYLEGSPMYRQHGWIKAF